MQRWEGSINDCKCQSSAAQSPIEPAQPCSQLCRVRVTTSRTVQHAGVSPDGSEASCLIVVYSDCASDRSSFECLGRKFCTAGHTTTGQDPMQVCVLHIR